MRKIIRRFSRAGSEGLWSAGILLMFLGGWEAIVRWYQIPIFILPSPTNIAKAFWDAISQDVWSPAGFYIHTYYTVGEALCGYVVGSALGIALGTVISQSRFVERIIFPYILALQCLPKVAIAPLLIVWFSTGFLSKVVIVALLTFFPLLVNSMAGFANVSQEQIELMRAFRASSWQVFRKIKFPSSLPFIFAGLNMAIIYSLIGAVVGEFLGARRGLGVMILNMNANLDTAGVFAVFVVLTAIGMIMYGSLRWLERRVTFWTRSSEKVIGL